MLVQVLLSKHHGRERDVLTVDFFPQKIPFPKFTPEDLSPANR